MAKPMMSALTMESVMVPLFTKSIDANDVFAAREMQVSHAGMMLDALAKWTKTLAAMRVTA